MMRMLQERRNNLFIRWDPKLWKVKNQISMDTLSQLCHSISWEEIPASAILSFDGEDWPALYINEELESLDWDFVEERLQKTIEQLDQQKLNKLQDMIKHVSVMKHSIRHLSLPSTSSRLSVNICISLIQKKGEEKYYCVEVSNYNGYNP